MKVLFIHGLASSGAYKMASSLRILLKGSEVIAPDVPIEPGDALNLLKGICRDESPDLIVGLSLGGFWAQKLRGYRKILVNPDFHISRLLRTMTGVREYLSPRRDGALTFTVTDALYDEYARLESVEFDELASEEVALTTGMFADRDEMVNCKDEFEAYYPGRSRSYPGTHLPNYPEIKKYILPVIEYEVSDK